MKRFIVSILLILGLVLCTSSSLANNTERAVIDGKTSDRVHLRVGPSTDSKSLGLYFTGTEVSYITNTVDEWVWVNIGSETGYIKSEFLHFGNDPGSVIAQQPIGTVNNKNSNWVNLRPDPTSEYEAIGKCYNGDTVTILGETVTEWYYVKVGSEYGYISADFLQVGSLVSTTQPPAQGSSGGTPSDRAAFNAYQSVMQNKTTFTRAYDKQYVYLKQHINSFSDIPMQVTRFAVIDLDYDGMLEVILREAINGQDYGFLVFDYQGGLVYGFDFTYRAMTDLKADGTFYYSSGAADNGIGTLRFAKDEYFIAGITYCESGNDANNNVTSFYVNNEPSTLDAYRSAVDKWDDRIAVMWYDFTENNINAIFPSSK